MSELGGIAVTLPMALALGFAYGAGPCLVSCAPYLAPIYLADNSEGKKSWGIIFPFSIGRVVGYSVLGALFAAMGGYLSNILKQNEHIAFIFGVAMVLVGASLLARLSLAAECCVGSKKLKILGLFPKNSKLFLKIGVFFLGVSMAFNPCLPLGAVFVSAVASKDALLGALLGFAFGVGAVATSIVVFGVGMSYFASNLKERLSSHRHSIQKISAALLMFAGIWNVASSLKFL